MYYVFQSSWTQKGSSISMKVILFVVVFVLVLVVITKALSVRN